MKDKLGGRSKSVRLSEDEGQWAFEEKLLQSLIDTETREDEGEKRRDGNELECNELECKQLECK